MENTKKGKILIIISVLVLIAVVVGASFAYFSLTDKSGLSNTNASVDMPSAGTVTYESENNMSMTFTREQLATPGKYYAQAGDNEEATDEKAPIVFINIGTTDTNNTYECNFTLKVTKQDNDTLYDVFKADTNSEAGQMKLQIGSTMVYDLYTESLPLTISNVVVSGISSEETSVIYGYFEFDNSETKSQTALAGKHLSLKIDVDSVSCKIESN